MEPVPVERYALPAYPTRVEILADPALLEKHIPAFWRATAPLARATTVFLAANLAGCTGGDGIGPAPGGSRPVAEAPATAGSPEAVASAIVAPLFEHGDGRGATGCVISVPPVFLSEEEAMQVIREELARNGVTISEASTPLESVRIARRFHQTTELDSGETKGEIVEDPSNSPPFLPDGRGPDGRIAVEFVSLDEFDTLGGLDDSQARIVSKGGVVESVRMSVRAWDFKDTARWVASQVGKQGKGIYFGVFYDPVAYGALASFAKQLIEGRDVGRRSWEESKAEARRESLSLLKEQVQDFVGWLREKKVI